jgi:hypothetical protein
VLSKVRASRQGTKSGGKSFSRGALYELLSNPIYLGEIRHKQDRHPGQHQPILERELWDQVQQRLGTGARRDRQSTTAAPSSPRAGKVLDEHGEPLYAQGAAQGGRRYRYFVSRSLVRGSAADGERGWRVPAPELERAVLSALRSILGDQAGLTAGIEDPAELEQILTTVANWRERLDSESAGRTALTELIKQVQLTVTGLRVTVNLQKVSSGGAEAGFHGLISCR